MTAAYRLKGLGWMGGVTMVALAFYLVSLQVASERKHLESMNRQIAGAQRDIRALETEFDTRANLAQLERWNGDTLALVAPTAGQFVRDEAQLAAISFDGTPATAGSAGQVQTAQLIVPSLSGYALAAITPAVIETASTTRSPAPAVLQVAKAKEEHAPQDRPATTPALTRIAAITKPAAAAMPGSGAASKRRVELRKAEAMAMLDRSLLSDSTLGDLLSGARTERRSR
ncbi:conserved hypothetical protein [Sphingomonas sp. EC-HK361]|uniref:hypothetical protein n=1 Tax=Sphingomonas sp. EC-HK361 TaxID=2038397 RepID=UPI00125C4809|nr:hypothetical protein [Sphingomonas sp. EC-HK361]VVT04541.1 conserved hypothetical protein [Sphingomonas sp. EC-HK361]